ncbi:helix-turn-helix domain-containing protein [Streptomyces sp. NPDC056987]|uniref:helix-turn-helix domain-containing protein n=1 Tax=Streptomyces sp. NPDC056987 TaxID=3345988 RepID=UPI003641F12F
MEQHHPSIRQEAVALLDRGMANRAVAERLNVPRGTVSWWRHEARREQGGQGEARRSRLCPVCDERPLDRASYAYLLGLYLGDGYISHYAKHRSPSLLVTMDDAWPGLQDAAEAAFRAVFPDNAICRQRRKGCQNIKVYFKHLTCLFPQTGPGRKHERKIELNGWQQKIVDEHPWEFLRGLIQLFTNTLDTVGVEWRRANAKNISVAKRASVALMDAHIGPKY